MAIKEAAKVAGRVVVKADKVKAARVQDNSSECCQIWWASQLPVRTGAIKEEPRSGPGPTNCRRSSAAESVTDHHSDISSVLMNKRRG